MFSVGLINDICPPSTGYAAYDVLAGPKEIHEHPWGRHEGGADHHVRRQLDLLTARA